MKITGYKPAKNSGNTIGFLGISIECNINGMSIEQTMEVTIMRNSTNGHLFVNWPSRQYQAPDGTTRYAAQMKWPKEKLDFVQQAVIRRFHEFVTANRPTVQQSASIREDSPIQYPTKPQYREPQFEEQLPF